MDESKVFLPESEMPQAWYNISPDLPVPLPPPLHPGRRPVRRRTAPIFPMSLIAQEMFYGTVDRHPDEVLRVRASGVPRRCIAPTPLRPGTPRHLL